MPISTRDNASLSANNPSLRVTTGPIEGQFNDYPTDAWRKSLVFLGKRRHDRILDTAAVTIADTAKWATSMAAIEGTPFVAVGSAATAKNLFILENTEPDKFDPGYHISSDDQSTMLLRSAFTAPGAIYSMSVSGNRLITGGSNGYAQVFELTPSELGQNGRGLSHMSECRVGPTNPADLRISPPGTMVQNLRLNVVEFAPTALSEDSTVETAERFLATAGKTLYLFNLKLNKIVAEESVGNDTLLAASWSPHMPSSLISTGGVDRAIKVLDWRLMRGGSNSAVVWKVVDAHKGAVTDVRFNPFVPFWMASCGEDAVVKLWDLRYLAHPVGHIDSHYQGIHSIAWSNMHCEILATASADRSWRAWSFSPDVTTAREASPNTFVGCPGTEWGRSAYADFRTDVAIGARLIGEWTEYTAPIIKVAASRSHVDTFYSLSAIGQICSHTILSEVFEPIIPHRFDGTQSAPAYDLERSIYVRDLSTAYSDVVSICRSARREGRLLAPHEKDLLDLCEPRPPIDITAWAIAQEGAQEDWTVGREAVNRVRDEIERWSYFLPPKFEEFMAASGMIKSKLRLDYEMAVLRCSLVTDVLKGTWENVVKAEKAIYKGMEMDPWYINGKTLKLLVQSVVQHDYIRGLNIGLKLVETIEDTPSRSFSDTADAFGLLLFPTVYDEIKWLPPPTHDQMPISVRRMTVAAEFAEQLLTDMVHDVESGETSIAIPSDTGGKHGRAPTNERPVIGVSERRKLLAGVINDQLNPAERKLRSLRGLSEDPAVLLRMLRMEIRLAKALLHRTPQFHDDVLKIMDSDDSDDSGTEDKRPVSERTISVYANRLYLDALLDKRRYEDYCAVCFDLISLYAHTPCATNLLNYTKSTFFVTLEGETNQKYSEATQKVAQAIQGTQDEARRNTLMESVVLLKEALIPLVRIGGYYSKLGTADRTWVEKIRKALLGLIDACNTSLFRTLDVLERFAGAGSVREAAQNVQSAVKEAAQGLNPRRPGAVGATATGGWNPATEIAADVNALIDALGKVGKVETPMSGNIPSM